jgi:transposase InsO family protein
VKFAFIQAQKAEFPVEMMCQHLSVSRSGYYAFCHRGTSVHRQQDQALGDKIQAIHQQSRGTYGRPRVQAVLRAQGVKTSSKRVGRLMKQQGLQAKKRRRYRTTTDSGHTLPVAPNVLARAFWAQAPNQAWVGDITFIPTAQGWLYLAVLLDLFSRRVIGWSMGETIDRNLCLSALQMALHSRRPPPGLVHHTDRGSQYASADYQAALLCFGLVGSMSRKGNCWDNAVAESFFATLKTELCHHRRFTTHAEARQAIFEYIEVFYNRERLHSSLDYRSPSQYESLYRDERNAA